MWKKVKLSFKTKRLQTSLSLVNFFRKTRPSTLDRNKTKVNLLKYRWFPWKRVSSATWCQPQKRQCETPSTSASQVRVACPAHSTMRCFSSQRPLGTSSKARSRITRSMVGVLAPRSRSSTTGVKRFRLSTSKKRLHGSPVWSPTSFDLQCGSGPHGGKTCSVSSVLTFMFELSTLTI